MNRKKILAAIIFTAMLVFSVILLSGCSESLNGKPFDNTGIPVKETDFIPEKTPDTNTAAPSETPDTDETPVLSESPAFTGTPNLTETTTPDPSKEVTETPALTATPTPELTPTPTPTPSPTPEPTPTPTPIPTPVPYLGNRYGRVIDPDSIDYSFLDNIEDGCFQDVNQSTGQWHSGQWVFDSDGKLKCIYDKSKATLDFLSAHHSYDRLPTSEKKISLAITVGYYNEFFPQFVEVLKEKGVSAVFYLTGSAISRSSGSFLKSIIARGNVIGCHSYAHKDLPDLSYREIVEDANTFCETLSAKIGFKYLVKYYMPPAGGSTKRDIALLEYLGYTVSFWTFTYRDYDKQPIYSDDEAFEKLTHSVFPGCVVYIHGTSKMTLRVLSKYIDYVRSQGFEFVLPNGYFE